MKLSDIIFFVAQEANKKNDCSLKTKQSRKNVNVNSVTICNKKFMSYSNTLLESLILAQDERWRRA